MPGQSTHRHHSTVTWGAALGLRGRRGPRAIQPPQKNKQRSRKVFRKNNSISSIRRKTKNGARLHDRKRSAPQNHDQSDVQAHIGQFLIEFGSPAITLLESGDSKRTKFIH
jgi:hypothetical protein